MSMRKGFKSPWIRAVLAAAIIPGTAWATGDTWLDLDLAETLALHDDPALRMTQARSLALDEQAVAAAQLPDPMFKVGVMSLPTDSFHLGQEPMTQVQVGVVQKFPRGDSRTLQAEQLHQVSGSLQALGEDQRLGVLRAVREAYLEVLLQVKLADINAGAIAAFADLADITQDYYATGRAPQQDVLRASVELARAEDRATRIAQAEDEARARLGLWIGAAALRQLRPEWPEFGPVPRGQQLLGALPQHPRVEAAQQQLSAAETGVELARQRYKPEFSIDLTYGGRGGLNADGRSRPDLFSAMLMMDVPLFTGKRQDRVVAARAAESSAAAFDRDDTWRQLRSEAELHSASLERQGQRLQLFEETLLPQAQFSAAAALEAYRSAVADLTTLMRARIIEFELQLDYARLQAEALKTQARLLYLLGEAS